MISLYSFIDLEIEDGVKSADLEVLTLITEKKEERIPRQKLVH